MIPETIERVRIQAYDLPLRRPWSSARGGFDRRCGWLVRLESEGVAGFGDCAPLPAAGTETARTAARTLDRVQASALAPSTARPLDDLDAELNRSPSVRYALDCALADLSSRLAGVPLARHLSPSPAERIAVNAMLGPLDEIAPEDLARAGRQGFQVVKLKVGLRPLDEEIQRLTQCARHLPPGIRLRLDANGAWNAEEAKRLVDAIVELPIESVEEPLRDPVPETLAALQARVPFPLARDESIQGLGPDLDPAALGVRRLVVKPAALGGLDRTLALAHRADRAGIELVVTSLVESAAGLWPTVQLAAAIGGNIPHGLATADWLAEDLGRPPRPRDGWIRRPTSPGSGFIADRP
ncbi:o-succinylbenzoate synthase [Imhoffiella purpurea]|uniref:o-succinylbenzoate synthase n=1 Tax=Imhoffiella purpurea TaxID=1249627 RepID=W9VYU8_9GAMM|nr:o-succinylbenzoate synthase [Imhoffiella purpurea]EXJ15585.1 Mandelate racemase/muconate lactonizing enzyme [Imhoffiella purpurea]